MTRQSGRVGGEVYTRARLCIGFSSCAHSFSDVTVQTLIVVCMMKLCKEQASKVAHKLSIWGVILGKELVSGVGT